MPLPCSPASTSEKGDSSRSATEYESESDLITPRPGPTNPSLRTHANLSTPVPPFSSWSSSRDHRFYDFTSESEIERPKRGVYHSTTASEFEEDSSKHDKVAPPTSEPSRSKSIENQTELLTPAATTSAKKDVGDHPQTQGPTQESDAKLTGPEEQKRKISPRASPRPQSRSPPGIESKNKSSSKPRAKFEVGLKEHTKAGFFQLIDCGQSLALARTSS
jgi:hypothetical protein